jgi:hypothetical protein
MKERPKMPTHEPLVVPHVGGRYRQKKRHKNVATVNFIHCDRIFLNGDWLTGGKTTVSFKRFREIYELLCVKTTE